MLIASHIKVSSQYDVLGSRHAVVRSQLAHVGWTVFRSYESWRIQSKVTRFSKTH